MPRCDKTERRWKGFQVDAALKDSWLERLNAIPKIRIRGICVGHPSPKTFTQTHPYVVFEPLLKDAEAQVRKVFGDDALYFYGPFAVMDMDALPIEGRSAIIEFAGASSWFDKLLGAPRNIVINAPARCEDMDEEEFNWWWETVIGRLEKLGR